jgi:Uma2 family endonuclease
MAQAAVEYDDRLLVGPGRWTAQRALKELPETSGMTIEVLDGRLVVSPRPSTRHQGALRELLFALHPAAKRAGLAAYPEINLVCDEDLTSPDLTVIRPTKDERVWVPASEAVMVVEIMSTGSKRKDRHTHPEVYAREKIRYYMRVEFRKGVPVIFLHELVDGEYRPVVVAPAGTTFTMREPFDFAIDPAVLADT